MFAKKETTKVQNNKSKEIEKYNSN